MKKTPPNDGKPYTPADMRHMDKLIGQNTPTRLIAHKMGRSPGAVQQKANSEGRSLKPTNQSPYGTKK